jgi:class 3 adenylate cyclase/tetratricopeptide (TPR) repeat protein
MDVSCPACGAANPPTGRFCRECGGSLSSACPSCGAAVDAQQRFCGECGTALPGRSAPAAVARVEQPAAALVTERRMCSVLFCDLVGFTPLSESRDAEEVRELLSRYFEMARTVIGRYGGVVEKFIGDAVMAVWGTPVAVEGDTERAVRAALELVASVAALGAEIGAPTLAARGGVVTGEVAVTVGATNQGMVAGDAVNTASRVQSVATPGAVFVDAATQRLAQAGVEFIDAGEFELKGKTEPQRLWRAGRVLSNVGGAQRVDGLEAPITGRDLELRLIKDLFHASADRRQPRLVAVTGPAGVGKSRLGWEFEKYIDGLSATVWWHRGRCLSYGEGVSYWALAEIVRQRLGIAEEDPVDVGSAKLVAGVARYVPDETERGYIGVRLARLLGLPYPDDAAQELSREELFAGWRLWFERLADGSPVAMLIEDLQYADEGLLDFLDHLLDWARDAPIFVLTFSRPDMRIERSTWAAGRNRTPLALDPLDAASMQTLLDALVPDLPGGAAAAIADQAQGIPLFAVETIRALIDRDIVIPIDGAYRLVGELGTLSVPDSLHGLLAARLDALAPETRALVADASVLGTSFPAEALVAVSGSRPEQVRAALAELVRREVFEIVADPLSPQRGTYRFAHDMLRQVAYETLSRHDRKARHLAVAEHLRGTFANDGEEVVDVIARHYLDALSAAADAADADETRERAIEVLTRAGERANRTGDKGRAAAQFARAAELRLATAATDAAADAAGLWERAAEAALDNAEWDSAVSYADRAQERYVDIGQQRSAARTQIIAGTALRRRGVMAEARERLERAVSVLREDPDTDTVRGLGQLSALELFGGAIEIGLELGDEALGFGQALDVGPALMASLYINYGIGKARSNRNVESATYFRDAARLGELAGDPTLQGLALLNLADNLNLRDPAAAAEAARTAVSVLRRFGSRYALAGALENLALALLCTADWDAAAAALARAVDEVGAVGLEFLYVEQALIAGLRGDVTTARDLLAETDEFELTADLQSQSLIAWTRGVLADAERRPADALVATAEILHRLPEVGFSSDSPRWAWPLASKCGYEIADVAELERLDTLIAGYRPGEIPPMIQAERELNQARIAARSADPAAAERFAAAIATMRTRSTPYHLAHGLLDYAEHLASLGRAGDGSPFIEEARTIGERLGAGPLVLRSADMAEKSGSLLSS